MENQNPATQGNQGGQTVQGNQSEQTVSVEKTKELLSELLKGKEGLKPQNNEKPEDSSWFNMSFVRGCAAGLALGALGYYVTNKIIDSTSPDVLANIDQAIESAGIEHIF